MRKDRVPSDEVAVHRFADMRYVGQSYELEVPLPDELGPHTIEQVVEEFHELHQRIYGHSSPEERVEFVTLRAVCTYGFPPPRLTPLQRRGKVEDARSSVRAVFFPGADEPVTTAIYDRSRIPTGVSIRGPSVIEQADTTTVVEPGLSARLDEYGNLIVTFDGV
jgi:N-methylhydantoinase A